MDTTLDDPCADGVPGESGGIMDIEFLHQMLTMLLYSFNPNVQLRSGLFVGLAFGDQLENFHFP